MSTRADSFGDTLLAYRKRLGMSQRTLAERGGLTASYLNRIEKGTRKSPSLEPLLRMIEALHLTKVEAENLVQLAGYSPVVLEVGEGIALSGPTIAPTSFDDLGIDVEDLYLALAKLPPERRQACVDALVQLIDNLVAITSYQRTSTSDSRE